MIDLGEYNFCICKKINSIPSECVNEYRFSDNGKSVQLKPGPSEKTTLITIDKCLIPDSRRKCDCLFIYETKHKNYTFLVELKGKNHIDSAFDQLSKTRKYDEYKSIISQLKHPVNKYVIVSDIHLNKVALQKLEKEYNIRVGSILYSEPSSRVPDLKMKLRAS